MNEIMNIRVQCQAGPVCLHDQPCHGSRRPTASSTGYGPTASSTGYDGLPPHWTRRNRSWRKEDDSTKDSKLRS